MQTTWFLCLMLLVVLLPDVTSLTNQEIEKFINAGCASPVGSVAVRISGVDLHITSNAIPDHKWWKCVYKVRPQTLRLTVPKNPVLTNRQYCVPNIIGIARNGVPFLSSLSASGNSAVQGANSVQTDKCGGYVNADGLYGYQRLPVGCGMYNNDLKQNQLLGVALDGHAIYGPYQSDLGRAARKADLDQCGGRTVGATYRYVLLASSNQNSFPYFMGCFVSQPRRLVPNVNIVECNPGASFGQICSCGAGIRGYNDVTRAGNPTTTDCSLVIASDKCVNFAVCEHASVVLIALVAILAVGTQ